MVRIAMVIKREVDDAQNIRDVGVKYKRKESQPSSSGKVAAIKSKVRVDHLQVADISWLIANQGRGHVSIANSLDT